MKCTELSKCKDVFAASDVQRYLWACEGLARCLQKRSLGNLAKPSLKDISQRYLSAEISFVTETHPRSYPVSGRGPCSVYPRPCT